MRNKTMILLMFITLSFLFIAFAPCWADDIIYGCYKKKTGQMRIVNGLNKCVKSELPISWNRQASLPQKTSQSIKVYNAKSQFLGHLLDQGGSCVNIYIPSLKRTIEISLIDGNIFTERNIYFESYNCEGQPLTDPTFEIIYNSGKYYIAEEDAPKTMDISSRMAGNQCTNYPNPMQHKVVKPLGIETLPFTIPVAIPLRLE